MIERISRDARGVGPPRHPDLEKDTFSQSARHGAGARADPLQDLVDASLAEVLALLAGHQQQDVDVFREPFDQPVGLGQARPAFEDRGGVVDGLRDASEELVTQ
jgi:hypothetical protein